MFFVSQNVVNGFKISVALFSYNCNRDLGGKNLIVGLNCFLHQDFFYEDMESLTQMLRTLATDGNKHRAKVDKRKQRSVFRDVLRAVEVSGPRLRPPRCSWLPWAGGAGEPFLS